MVGFGQFFESDDADIGVADEFVVILPAAVGIAFSGAVSEPSVRKTIDEPGTVIMASSRPRRAWPVYAVVAVLVGFVERESQIDAEYVSFGLLVVREYKVGIIFVERHIFEVAETAAAPRKKSEMYL